MIRRSGRCNSRRLHGEIDPVVDTATGTPGRGRPTIRYDAEADQTVIEIHDDVSLSVAVLRKLQRLLDEHDPTPDPQVSVPTVEEQIAALQARLDAAGL